ncbi:MAG TPA: hypothetical protein VKZ65_15930, partial [Glycomyces sp.]|nr:hypothetical protein [Glycomyces sp.]
YAVGPWMAANLERVLEPECPSLAVWIIRSDGARARATWIRRGKWEFASAFQSRPTARLMTSTELSDWIQA